MKTLKELMEMRSAKVLEIDAAENAEQLAKIELDLRKIDMQIEERKKQEQNPQEQSIEEREALKDEKVPGAAMGGFEQRKPEDAEMEYRKAFMAYVTKGTPIPKELRADAAATTSTIGAVIPTTIMNEVIKSSKIYGQLYSRVRKMNVQGGVDIPIADVIPTATWITEATPSDRKSTTMNTKVSFSYYMLELKLSQTILATVVSLPLFEEEVTRLLVEGMTKAMDVAIMNGSGSGQPTGILNDTRVPATQKMDMKVANFTWEGWKMVFAQMPLANRDGGVLITTSANWEIYIDGMTDSNGQPVARTTYGIDGKPNLRFMGREVVLVENDILDDYATATDGDAFAVVTNLTDYAMNSNMQMNYKIYLDDDTNQYVHKALTVVDGKLLSVDNTFILKKATESED